MVDDSRPLPDFAIVGGPKCGTTSLHAALAKHPQIRMSSIKEPYYFAADFPGQRYITDEKSYRMLYHGRLEGKLCGEASVVLRSKMAIPEMLRRNPNLKTIAVVRDPIEMFRSMHNENVRMCREDVLDVEEAWDLQEARAEGRFLPPGCQESWMLQYRYICSLGEQIDFLFQMVPEERRLVLLFDDLKADPEGCLETILRFLELDHSVRIAVPVMNSFSIPRSTTVASLLRFLVTNRRMNRFQARFRPILDTVGMDQIKWLFALNLAKVPKQPLHPAFRERLVEAFRGDVAHLSFLLGRDLTGWPGFSAGESAVLFQKAYSLPKFVKNL